MAAGSLWNGFSNKKLLISLPTNRGKNVMTNFIIYRFNLITNSIAMNQLDFAKSLEWNKDVYCTIFDLEVLNAKMRQETLFLSRCKLKPKTNC